MASPLAKKLSSFTDLSREDHRALEQLSASSTWRRGGDDLIEEGDRPEHVFLLLDGWACRYKLLEDGNRQIMAYLVPGDLCDPHVFILDEMDHSIGLLSDACVATISKDAMVAVTR